MSGKKAGAGSPLLTFIITTARDGTVRLSKAGHWGNIPKVSEEAAEIDAAADARHHPFVIERKRLKR